MNQRRLSSFSGGNRLNCDLRRDTTGAALVATLAILTLLLGLTIALFLSATNERRSANLYKNSQGLRELSDTAVNLVQAQIKDATTENAALAPAARHAWASQPGMIRTYGSGTNAINSYKLYSWANPRVAGDAADSVPAQWFDNKALYTDLNEPVPDSGKPGDTNAFRYPIAYPPDTNAAVGYSVIGAPVATSGAFVNSIPMPVQWLYILQNGALAYPTSSTGSTVTIPGATEENPIVGRVAYWTDDETSKVNLNTAAGGPFWMTPVFGTTTGFNYANYQPMQFEFQRFPGHPARTDLRAVFPDLTATSSPSSLYAFAPRIQFGGSMAALAAGNNTQSNTNAVTMDADRLFASVGEARFSANATSPRGDFPAPAPTPAATPAPAGSWQDRIERNKFLVTASSRAPEITIYGTPRLSIWPEPAAASASEEVAKRTPYDSLIAFCASLPTGSGVDAYYFDRVNPLSPTVDISRPRNTQLLGYLNGLMTTSAIPGSGSAGFLAKGDAADLGQIQTSIFDYIRTTNLTDTHPQTGNTVSYSLGSIVVPSERTVAGRVTRGFGRFFTLNQFGMVFAATAADSNATSNVATNRSLQSSPGAANATLLVPGETRVMGLPLIELANAAAGTGGTRPNLVGGVGLRIRGLDGIQVVAGGVTHNLGMPASADLGTLPDGGYYNLSGYLLSKNNGGFLFHTTPLRNLSNFKPLREVNGFTGAANGYPISRAFTVPTGSTMTVSCANPIEVEVYTTTGSNTITIPPFSDTIAAPILNSNKEAWAFQSSGIGVPDVTAGRTSALTNNAPSYGLIYQNDSVLALATRTGDYRLNMVNREAGDDNFDVVNLLPSNPRMRHRFFSPRSANVQTNVDSLPATAVNNVDVPGGNTELLSMGILRPRGNNFQIHPRIPTFADYPAGEAHPSDWSDFNNGYPQVPDGPYTNKPDEGEVEGLGANAGTMPYFGQARGDSIQVTTGGGGQLGGTNAMVWASPNREIASPVAFGSLPSATLKSRPWQNLLFRPAPTSLRTGKVHPGAAGLKWDGSSNGSAPPDHYLLDYFWMPVVEPWAVSERFSTAGKINLNYEIAPFSYIKRETPIYALLNTEVIPATPSISGPGSPSLATWQIGYGKASGTDMRPAGSIVAERECNVVQTLAAIKAERGGNALFSSASQLTEIPLIPKGVNNSLTNGPTAATIETFWNNNRMTGDNMRELPYNNVYSRVTTKSNTYTVHYQVQVLKKIRGSDPTIWDETKDKFLSELRGQTLIERYLDPNAIYPDYATNFAGAPSLEQSYRFRVLQRSDFTP